MRFKRYNNLVNIIKKFDVIKKMSRSNLEEIGLLEGSAGR